MPPVCIELAVVGSHVPLVPSEGAACGTLKLRTFPLAGSGTCAVGYWAVKLGIPMQDGRWTMWLR